MGRRCRTPACVHQGRTLLSGHQRTHPCITDMHPVPCMCPLAWLLYEQELYAASLARSGPAGCAVVLTAVCAGVCALCLGVQGNALGRGPTLLHLPMRLLATIRQRAAPAIDAASSGGRPLDGAAAAGKALLLHTLGRGCGCSSLAGA